ncbi:bifunctional TVP38/TMEM64 family protein/FAD-dependent oxidoreductase [Ramlibacter sp.]|uniref:FAD-dependent oxidoreductase n=1 Tax=Ramlibacter sp. TaxID=1917967 RepID=UPI001835DCCF|nr:bifunctional TVP38/TMEM64 family protein/FAD-dependent oxidoreductase [Ramlibacter sp.]MBA2675946.1 FAD-dependent oxidoreductase [Ramlibacter sp.]
MKLQIDKRWWAVAALAFAIIAFFVLDLGQYLRLSTIKSSQAQLEAWRAAQPLQAALIFFAAYVLVTALSLPGAAVLTLAGGAIFGLGWGTLLISFASSIGATLAFLASRWLLGDWVQSHFGERMAALNAGVAKDGGFYLFTLRLVPVVPFFVINLAMGLTHIRPLTFYWVSQLGMLAGTIVYVNAGTQLARIDSLSGVVSPGVLGSLVLLGLFPLIARKVIDVVRARKIYLKWQRPEKFDRNLVVIGAGSAGLVTAYIAATVRAKVTLVEKNEMGGDCLNTGCVPSKALIRSARFLSHVKRSNEFGIRSATADFEFAEVMERVQRVIQDIEPHDSIERYTALGVDVVQGEARIASPWEVEIAHADGSKQMLTTRSIVIAAGGRPLVPPIPGLDQINYLTSDNVWALRERPGRMVVLGGGPIGCELAQTFARLGCRITQVEKGERILPREDDDAAALVTRRFVEEGIDLRFAHEASRIEVVEGEKVLVALHDGKEVRIAFDALLIAVGRQANLDGYGLKELGVTTERTVQVNDYLQTSFPNIYAAGDVAGPYQFTHTASHQAWYAAVNALFDPFKKFRADYRVIPWATFVEPEVARVGLNEQEAREKKIPHEVTVYGIDDLDRAIADSEAHGFVKVITVPGKDRILGVTIVGEHAGDLIAEYVLAMKHGIGLNKILGTIHIYPTMAEANKYVAGNWKRAHGPEKLLTWVGRFHARRRG